MLRTERLILREWEDRDLEPFRVINSDPKVMEFYPGVLDASQSDRIVERAREHFDKHGFGLYAVELAGTKAFVGFVGLQHVPLEAHFTPAIEIGWRIAAPYWNQGYATEAARHCLEFAFQSLKLREIVAMTYVGNHRSRRVMEKLGMSYDPKDDFICPHPSVIRTHLAPHVLYRIQAS